MSAPTPTCACLRFNPYPAPGPQPPASRPAFRIAVNADRFTPFDQLRTIARRRSDFLMDFPHLRPRDIAPSPDLRTVVFCRWRWSGPAHDCTRLPEGVPQSPTAPAGKWRYFQSRKQ